MDEKPEGFKDYISENKTNVGKSCWIFLLFYNKPYNSEDTT